MERPLTTDEDGPAQLFPYLVEALEEVMSGIGPMVEEQARVLFPLHSRVSSATTTSVNLTPILTSCWSLWTASATPLLPKP